jgi:hypothetical protein
MRPRPNQRGSALLMSIIVILVISVIGVGVIRFASREVAGATAGRKEAAAAACAETARVLLMSQWKLLGAHGVNARPLDIPLGDASQTRVLGGHYGQKPPDDATYWNAGSGTWVKNIQVIPLDPLTVGSAYVANDLTNRIGDSVQNYRVVVHCTQGSGTDARDTEVEFGVQYGL